MKNDKVLTEQELWTLIGAYAQPLGLSAEEAVKRARAGTLPRDAFGVAVSGLARLLPEEGD